MRQRKLRALCKLEVVTDKETNNEIVSENPRIQKYLDQNEVFADLEIITDQNEIEKSGKKIQMWRHWWSQRILLSLYVKGNGVRLRSTRALPE